MLHAAVRELAAVAQSVTGRGAEGLGSWQSKWQHFPDDWKQSVSELASCLGKAGPWELPGPLWLPAARAISFGAGHHAGCQRCCWDCTHLRMDAGGNFCQWGLEAAKENGAFADLCRNLESVQDPRTCG